MILFPICILKCLAFFFIALCHSRRVSVKFCLRKQITIKETFYPDSNYTFSCCSASNENFFRFKTKAKQKTAPAAKTTTQNKPDRKFPFNSENFSNLILFLNKNLINLFLLFNENYIWGVEHRKNMLQKYTVRIFYLYFWVLILL